MAVVKVYNAGGGEVLHTVSLQHAVGMLHRKVARAVEVVEGETFGPYPRPRAVELLRYVFTRWKYERRGKNPNSPAVVSRVGILLRDKHECAYCTKNRGTTIDHIFPRARGGQTTWMNCVAACRRCNERKGRKLLKHSGFTLRFDPFEPLVRDLDPRVPRRVVVA